MATTTAAATYTRGIVTFLRRFGAANPGNNNGNNNGDSDVNTWICDAFATAFGSQIQCATNGNNNGDSVVNASMFNICATNLGCNSAATTMATASATPLGGLGATWEGLRARAPFLPQAPSIFIITILESADTPGRRI